MPTYDETKALPPARRRFWQKRKRYLALLLLMGLVSFAALAPTLVGTMPPLLQAVVDSAVPSLRGKTTVGSASLGWFSPVVVRDVAWRDPEGAPLANVDAIRLERTLWQLLLDRADIGTIHVERPHLKVIVREDGSNLEDALASLMSQANASTGGALKLVVQEGSIELIDAAQELAWQIEGVEATLAMSANLAEPSQVSFKGNIHDAQGTPRPLEGAFAWHAPTAEPQAGQPGGTLTLRATDTPLAMLRAALRRAVPASEIHGEASCDLQLTYNADLSHQQLDVRQLVAKNLVFAAPQYTTNEALRLADVAASGEVQVLDGRVKLSGVKFATDVARGSADGQLPLAGWNQNATQSALAALQNEDYVIHGEVDLAKLAALLPQTLRIREGTEITAGTVTLDLASQLQGKRRRFAGELKSSQLAALQHGREIVWDQPISITLTAQQSTSGLVIERLACAASFLNVQARGTLDEGEITASGDLAQLLAEANRFIDMDDLRLAGQLSGSATWRRQPEAAGLPREEDNLALQGQTIITEFELVSPGQQAWREPRVTVDVAATGKLRGSTLATLEAAALRLIAGDEGVQVELSDAIAQPLQNSVWPLAVSGKGELARWLPRLQAWLPVAVEQASGQATFDAKLISSAESIEIRQAKLDVVDLKLQALGLSINEPEAHFDGDGLWHYPSQRWQSRSLTLATSALACRGENLMVQPLASGVAISGDVGYRADLERLTYWLTPAGTTPPRKWQGMTDGRLKFTHQGNVTQGKWTAEFTDIVLARPRMTTSVVSPVSAPGGDWETIFTEPKLAWHGQGEFDHARDRLVASHLNVTSDMINVTARGQIDAVTTAPVVDLTGEIAYDLQNVAAILASYVGSGLKMNGADKRQFVLRGPLPSYATFASQDPNAPRVQKLVWPKELVGRASLGWTSAEVYGLPLGEGSIDGALESGIVNFAPLDVRVAEGRVKAWPRLVLSNEPMVFQLAKGTSVEQVEITPQMCQTWLKFVAPLLADATRAQGKFSAKVEGATFPLLTPEAGDARGVLTVHGAQVGPGPLAEQYVLLATQIRSLLERKPLDPNFRASSVEWLTLPQQDVQVEMNGGRVYHQGLQIQVRDTTLVTSGSVGVDQTLSLVVEVPIRDEWIAKDRLLAGLRGQSLKVPVSGTVGQPRLDGRALEQLAGQLFQNAAGSLIENKLQEGLDKLFRPKPAP